jgi:hypothetical protein
MSSPMSLLPLLLLLAGCEPEPPPAIDEVDWAAATGLAVLALEAGVITLDGQHVGELREPGVLRQSRHRKLLKALKLRSGQDPDSHDPQEQALLSRGWPVRVELSPADPWDDVYPLVATAAWAGFGPFELVLVGEGGRAVGPLATDTRQPAAWSGEPITGVQAAVGLVLGPAERCADLHYEVLVGEPGSEPLAALRQLPQVLRTIGSEPLVDCAAVYGDAAALVDFCTQAQLPVGQAFLPAEGVVWPPAIPAGQRGMGLDPALGAAGGRAVVTPAQETPVSAVIDELATIAGAGDVQPVIGLTKPAPSEDITCSEVKLQSIEGVHQAGARWLGEHHQPLR